MERGELQQRLATAGFKFYFHKNVDNCHWAGLGWAGLGGQLGHMGAGAAHAVYTPHSALQDSSLQDLSINVSAGYLPTLQQITDQSAPGVLQTCKRCLKMFIGHCSLLF